MDLPAKQRRLEVFQGLCRERGQPFTLQRRVILEAALDLENHPTADQVHDLVSRRHPGISRTTVYRTLETLVRMGVITKACHAGRVIRYDCRTETHHHLICLSCDQVIDISDKQLDTLPIPDTTALGFEVTDLRVQLRGICECCREEERT